MKFLENLGLKPYNPVRVQAGKVSKNTLAWFSFRVDKNGRKSIVINFDKSLASQVGWTPGVDRINMWSQPGSDFCGIVAGKRYAIIKSSIQRCEVKIVWTPELCDVPLNRLTVPIDMQVHVENGEKFLWFKLPKEIFEPVKEVSEKKKINLQPIEK
jgi:hypothetical protein